MDILGEFIEENELSVPNIRKLIDDYSLISFYIGAELELNTCYSSPLRVDDTPSFSLFYPYGKNKSVERLLFKDHVKGSGDVYDFLCMYFDTTLKTLLKQIDCDLELNLGTGESPNLKKSVLKMQPLIKERPKIKLVSCPPTEQFLAFWDKIKVEKDIRDLYEVKCLEAFQYVYTNKTVIKTPRDLCMAYCIGDFNKIYRPQAPNKKDKFRTDFPPSYVEGHLQIDWSRKDFLLITKASKECMFFRQHFNVQAVAGKSESTEIHPHFIQMYLKHFDRVAVWLDPDPAGIKMMRVYTGKYNEIEGLSMPSYIDQKDPTDFFAALQYDSLPIINEVLYGR